MTEPTSVDIVPLQIFLINKGMNLNAERLKLLQYGPKWVVG